MPTHTVVLQRKCGQRTSDKKIEKQVQYILSRALGGSRGNGWEGKIGGVTEPIKEDGGWRFSRKLILEKTSGHKGVEEKQWQAIVAFMVAACRNSKFGVYPWFVVDGVNKDIMEAIGADESVLPKGSDHTIKDTKNYAEIKIDPADCFKHIYQRDHQINIMMSALAAAKDSQLENRFHCVLFGSPGCGKSDLLLSMGKMLGNENEHYLKFDATSTTEAGASRLLLESDWIPPVLIVEEIEKTDEKSLRWLLGVLDQRAEIRRTNFRIGNRARNVKMLVFATVNNIALFRSVMSGALSSRFPNEVYCPRPDRHVLKLILEREVKKTNGNPKWIEPTLKYCWDDNRWDDPRKFIPVCLCGRDALLDGSYQKSLDETRLPREVEAKC